MAELEVADCVDASGERDERDGRSERSFCRPSFHCPMPFACHRSNHLTGDTRLPCASFQENGGAAETYTPALSDTSRAKPAQSEPSRPFATVAVSRSWIKEASGIGASPSAAASRISP